MVQLEFKIYPDGRIEEKVTGAKGRECLEITEKINEALGEVYKTEATGEMYEQKVTVQQEDKVKESTGFT